MSRVASLLSIFFCTIFSLAACTFNNDENTHHTPPPPTAAALKVEAVHAAPTPMDTFRALAPSEGLKFTRLFDDPVKDTDARIKRLEDAVQGLRNDFDTTVPSMVRLVSVEKDMKELVGQLQTLTEQPGAGAVAPVTAASSAPPPLPAMQDAVNADKSGVAGDASKQNQTPNKIPGGTVTGGTETAKDKTPAGPTVTSPLVTPEAAPEGNKPPDGAASPLSKPPSSLSTAPPKSSANDPAKKTASPEVLAQKTPVVITPPPAASASAASPLKTADAAPAKPAASATTPAPVVASPAQKAETKGVAGKFSGDVRDVRVADHKDKTRIVLDLTAKAKFVASLEDGGKTLVVEIDGMNWSAIKNFEATSGDLVSGYHVDGQKLKIELLYPATIQSKQLLLPKGNLWDRLVIDLFSKDVHKK